MDDEKLLDFHPHHLFTKFGSFHCSLCNHNEENELFYFCTTCNIGFHKICAESPSKIMHPYHPTHPLTYQVVNYDDPCKKCSLCHEDIGLDDSFYSCSLCNFSIHYTCKDCYVQPLVIHPECHEHKLAFRDCQISLPCNVCGLLNDYDDMSHYKCIRIQCGFRVHKDCIYLPPIITITYHQHRLSRIVSLPSGQWSCEICHGVVDQKYGAYLCNEGCSYATHLRCAKRGEVSDDETLGKPGSVLPPVHPHPLSFKSGRIGSCEVCYQANETDSSNYYYYCELCKLEFHEECAKSSSDVKLPSHHHPLHLRSGFAIDCHGCNNLVKSSQRNHYYCSSCSLQFHVECAKVFPEIKHPLHPRHPLYPRRPLKVTMPGQLDYSSGECQVCEKSLTETFYHCPICDFNMDQVCASKPPSYDIYQPKFHEHTLIILPRLITFICNACGLAGRRDPYICCQCDLMVHRECVNLPHLIRIIRHHHCLSYTFCLPRENWSCEVCHQKVDGKYGEYFCNKGCNYVAHVKCATGDDVWDGKELEKEPEILDETEDRSFKLIEDGVINHCSHEEHDLRLNKNNNVWDEGKLCEACVLPVLTYPYYSCMNRDCHFILHERCAHLPKKIRHISHRHPLTLHIDHIQSEDLQKYVFSCTTCGEGSSGFKYECPTCNFQIDMRCALVSEPFTHKGHEHPLFFASNNNKKEGCIVCGKSSKYMLNCLDCDFVLDFKCATLPFVVKYKYDEHLLKLDRHEKVSGQYWCEICEEELDAKNWFYTCDDCGVTSHVECTIGRWPSIHYKPGRTLTYRGLKIELVLNNRIPRHLCYKCRCRCLETTVFKTYDKYLCTLKCLSAYRRDSFRLLKS